MIRIALVAIFALGTLCPAAGQQSTPAFEVVSVKKQAAFMPPSPPSGPRPALSAGFYRANATVVTLVRFAHHVTDAQVIGGPEWIRQDLFEINARAGRPVPQDDMRPMVASMLAQRFRLVIRRESRPMRGSALVVSRSDGRLGPNLEKCDDPDAPRPPPVPVRVPVGSYPFSGRCTPMAAVAAAASGLTRMPVVDSTNLPGLWTYQFFYAQPDPLPPGPLRDRAEAENLRPFPAALQAELGLRLQESNGPFEVIVIESVQPPTEN